MGERGSVLPMLLGFVMAATIVLALAVDVTLYAAATREAAYAADAGAQAGATRIDEAARYRGELAIEEAAASAAANAAALEARPRTGRAVTVRTEPSRVCVTVTQPFAGRLVTVSPQISITACAVPVEG